MIKNEIRAIGIDDAPFNLREDYATNIVGVILRGKNYFEDVLKSTIQVDGVDSTDKIIDMIINSKFYEQVKVIFLFGITFGGFNTVNIEKLWLKTKLPVIVILEKMPEFNSLKEALSKLPYFEERWNAINTAGKIYRLDKEGCDGKVYFQFKGATYNEAVKLIRKFQFKSNIPEPVRIAHKIAKILKNNYKKEQ
ncbi:MAG: endonuclease dU [Candidatus Odinarchaeia archaeon]